MADYKLPEKGALIEMVMMISQERPTLSDAEFSVPDASHLGIYSDAADQPVALCFVDLPLSAGLGAMLSMIPPAAAQDMVSDGELTDTATGNLNEFMNMFSTLLMDDTTKHLKLTDVIRVGEDSVPELAAESKAIQFEMGIDPYGQGRIGFVTT